jgi:hypothetical protein
VSSAPPERAVPRLAPFARTLVTRNRDVIPGAIQLVGGVYRLVLASLHKARRPRVFVRQVS